jgi:hypothetical protein
MKYSSFCAPFAASLLIGGSSVSTQSIAKEVNTVSGGQAQALASYAWVPALATTTHAVQDAIDDSVSGTDALLMIVSGCVLSILQLRRKQKALRRAGLAISAT